MGLVLDRNASRVRPAIPAVSRTRAEFGRTVAFLRKDAAFSRAAERFQGRRKEDVSLPISAPPWRSRFRVSAFREFGRRVHERVESSIISRFGDFRRDPPTDDNPQFETVAVPLRPG